jgi:GrpB-like predicted nucleotidyltransferase (UPF0157 family)
VADLVRPDLVRIVPYDPAWPDEFEAEKARLEPILAPWLAGEIHHVGSTSVPGLAANPVIDILAEVRSLDESRGSIEPLHEGSSRTGGRRTRKSS